MKKLSYKVLKEIRCTNWFPTLLYIHTQSTCRDVDKKIVNLPEIRETGEYVAELKLHPEVTARVRLTVYANWD